MDFGKFKREFGKILANHAKAYSKDDESGMENAQEDMISLIGNLELSSEDERKKVMKMVLDKVDFMDEDWLEGMVSDLDIKEALQPLLSASDSLLGHKG